MNYRFLPFRFDRLENGDVFLANDVGEFCFITSNDFTTLINKELKTDCQLFKNLKAKQIITDTEVEPIIEMLAIKYRTKKSFLDNFTSLHMVVPTLRCNSNCAYCQVSKKDINDKNFDLDKTTAKKIVELIFESPSPYIKIEFQGGEPLLNFEIIKYIIELSEYKNVFKKKHLEFVICSNLTLISEKILTYLRKHNVSLSTSIDGPNYIHNKNRPLQENQNSYEIVTDKLKLCRKYLGKDGISALMTSTSFSLGKFREIIDTYIELGFHSIFLRSLNPYGFAKRDKHSLSYSIDSFIDNYIEGLNYIIELNLKGIYFIEEFATLLLTRVLTPFATGFMDLQSPSGVAICGAIYDYNGNIYVSDEGRMLASTGDNKFLMGNANKNSYEEIFNSNFIHSLTGNSCLESLPGCSYCAYQPYCGADPVRNYSEQGNIIGHRPTSEICKKNKEIIKHLLSLLKTENEALNDIFWSWINRKQLNPTKN